MRRFEQTAAGKTTNPTRLWWHRSSQSHSQKKNRILAPTRLKKPVRSSEKNPFQTRAVKRQQVKFFFRGLFVTKKKIGCDAGRQTEQKGPLFVPASTSLFSSLGSPFSVFFIPIYLLARVHCFATLSDRTSFLPTLFFCSVLEEHTSNLCSCARILRFVSHSVLFRLIFSLARDRGCLFFTFFGLCFALWLTSHSSANLTRG